MPAPLPPPPFGIQVLDDATGRGVPLVELETVNHLLHVTDSAGWAAVTAPELMGQETYFHIRSHGYTYHKDGFGYVGERIKVTPGGRARIRLRRENVAERVCRLTGGGIYADSVQLGEPVPLRQPVLAGKVFGQDSTMAAVYKGRMLWFWGDTDRVSYPLGNFRTTGAVATFPAGQKDARLGFDYRYFTGSDGFARAMLPSDKPGPIWIGGLAVLPEPGGDGLYTHYSRVKGLEGRYEHGYARWDDAAEVFRYVKELPLGEDWRYIDGHPIRLKDASTEYLAGGFCFPHVRVPATRDAFLGDPSGYEAFTCLLPNGDIRRDAQGRADYRWQRDIGPLMPDKEADLVKQGRLRPDEARFLPRDADGKLAPIHGGSVTWSPWRKKWLLIATRKNGAKSLLGEIVYGEADDPLGPWRRVVTILTHEKYTFYNPVHHPFLDTDGGRTIFFEGTYADTFSGSDKPTPRYNYNQMLYRLDLGDGRLRAVTGT